MRRVIARFGQQSHRTKKKKKNKKKNNVNRYVGVEVRLQP
jgi:hypothetical protein